jgi:hypothetical protein
VVHEEGRNITRGGGFNAFQRSSVQLAGKRKSNELFTSGDLHESVDRLTASSARAAPITATLTYVTWEQASVRFRQFGGPEGGVTYAAVVAEPVAPNTI